MTDDLIARLEAATGPDRELDAVIAVASGQYVHERRGRDRQEWFYSTSRNYDRRSLHYGGTCRPLEAYTASIDAALTLATGEAIERVGGAIGILRWAIDMMREAGAGIDALPRFIVIAALRAQEDREHGLQSN